MRYAIPNKTLDDQSIAILGQTGAGKTYAAKGLVERLLTSGRQVVVLDPQGIWWGLRSSADGEHGGKRVVVIGGRNGDMPLTSSSATNIARFVVQSKSSVVLDFNGMYLKDMCAFGAEFVRELFMQHQDERALWLVLEEADVWAPQSAPSGEAQSVLKEVDRVARHGRHRGFRMISICQRPAKINKDVLTQVSTLVALRLPGLHDRKVVRDWVEGVSKDAEEVYTTLPGLETGEAWIWTPSSRGLYRGRFPAITTLDTSQTPEAGRRRVKGHAFSTTEFEKLRALFDEIAGVRKDETKPRRKLKRARSVAGDAIVRVRKLAGLTQDELAKRIGSSQGSVGRIEAGGVTTTDMLERIAEATGQRLVISFQPKGEAD